MNSMLLSYSLILLAAYRLTGNDEVTDSGINDFLQENTMQHDYLIQPDYKNHPCLQTTSQGYLQPASTSRIIRVTTLK